MTPHEQQAEELARQCDAKIHQWFKNFNKDDRWEVINKELPIAHWLACEEALRGMSELCDNYFDESGLMCVRDREIWKQHIQALQSIDNWRKNKKKMK